MRPVPSHRRGERGAALLLAIMLVGVLLLVGVAVLRVAGGDRIDAAKLGSRERAQLCAEAGLQYGRRLFGRSYEATHNWNDYLDETSGTYVAGYRYDPDHLDDEPDLADRPVQVRGKSDGAAFDAGADLDGDAKPDFWVSIRDDDDELSAGAAANDSRRDNNESVILRSECTSLVYEASGGRQHAVVEAVFTHVQGASGYGNAQITSNSPDVVGQN